MMMSRPTESRLLAEIAQLKAERDDLLEALEQCVRRLDKLNTGGPSEPDPTVVKARAAITKAKGGV